MIIKPKVLRDISSKKVNNSFKKLSKRVDLSRREIYRFPFAPTLKLLFVPILMVYLVFGSALAPVGSNQLLYAADESREELEKQLEDLETQIAEYESTIDQYKKEGKNIESDINSLNAKINKLNLQIKSINLSLRKLDNDLEENKEQIFSTEGEIIENKDILGRSLQNIYMNEDLSVIEILLRRPKLSDFFGDVMDLFEIQESMHATLEKVMELREDLFDEKEMLALKKLDIEELYDYQASQKRAISETKNQKASLLEVTKSKEKEVQELKEQTEKTAAEIRSRIFKSLGGGELPFGEAVKIAQLAEKSTGIRAAFTLAVLTQESGIRGVIGANLGQCAYNEPWNLNPEGKVMRSSQAVAFERITSELDLDPEKMPVSCPIPRDGLYGGAMGPAQFMPTTWEMYEDRIAAITGNNPPSPWRNADAFVATSLYLKDAYNSSACVNYADTYENISPRQKLQERCAAAKYYAGGNWYTFRWKYGDPVAERADRLQKDINILDQ